MSRVGDGKPSTRPRGLSLEIALNLDREFKIAHRSQRISTGQIEMREDVQQALAFNRITGLNLADNRLGRNAGLRINQRIRSTINVRVNGFTFANTLLNKRILQTVKLAAELHKFLMD